MKKNGKHCKTVKCKNICIKIFSSLCIALFLFSFYKIFEWIIDNKKNEEIKAKTAEFIVMKDIEKEEEDTPKIQVDFERLKQINKEIVGYIRVNQTNIDYAVTQGRDNDYYLTHNLEKQNNSAGWIFADYHNQLDTTDRNIILYGHNMKNGSMFGSLHNCMEPEWYEEAENQILYFITEKENAQYRIFSIYQETASDYPIQTKFETENQYLAFLKNIQAKSICPYPVNLTKDSQIITLSTCGVSNRNRVVLHAVKMAP